MINYKNMSKLSAEDMVALWNKGFEGYFLNVEMNLDRFLARAVSQTPVSCSRPFLTVTL
jgi:hypothetical protein